MDGCTILYIIMMPCLKAPFKCCTFGACFSIYGKKLQYAAVVYIPLLLLLEWLHFEAVKSFKQTNSNQAF